MEIQKKTLSPSTLSLTISLAPAEYEKYLKQAAQQIGQTIKIKGFRPGTAPYHVIKQHVGEQEILNQAVERIVAHSYAQVVKENNYNTLSAPQIKIIKMAPNNPFVYQAEIYLTPEVKLPDISKLKINAPQIQIDDKEINKLLEQLAKSRAKEIAVDRAAQNKDLVKLDYNISINNVPQEDGQQKNFAVYLGEKHMVPGFEEQIIGLKAGQTKRFTIKFPDDYFQKNFAGKNCQFDVKINQVLELNIPKIDDAFAQSLGSFKNLNELKKQITDNLKLEKQQQADKELEQEMFELLIKKSTLGELPAPAIDHEVETIFKELEADLAQRGLTIETWLKNMNKTAEQLKKDLRPQAEKRLKSALIIKAVAQQEKLDATPEEIQAEIDKLTAAYKDDPDTVGQIKSSSYRDYLSNILTGQKVVKWLKEKIIQ